MVEAPRDADDLTAIRGIGPGLARQLNGLGVYKFSQLAAFSEEDLAWVDANLSSFKGRCFRDDWTGQAKVLLG
jgi:NADH-quinone oxidoreductase subunit E